VKFIGGKNNNSNIFHRKNPQIQALSINSLALAIAAFVGGSVLNIEAIV
jgi:hypothetical protein